MKYHRGLGASPAVQPPTVFVISHLFVFSATTRESLAEKVRACRAGDLAATAARLRSEPVRPCRLAIVAVDAAEFDDRRSRALAALERSGDGGFALAGAACAGVVDPAAPPARSVCLFPGFGVRQTRLVPELARLFPAVEAWLDALGIALGTYAPDEPAGSRGPSVGPPTMSLDAVLLADMAMWQVMAGLGWRPDAVAGHSFGENAALVASGLVDDFSTLIGVLGDLRAVADRTPATGGALGMLAVSAASRAVLDPLVDAEPPRAWVALDNCPQQIVVWGETGELESLERAIHQRREVAFRLPGLERPVHTPLFPVPFEDIRPHYDKVPIGRARVPAWSAARVRPFPDDPDAVRDMLAAQWRETVRFRALVERLHAGGVRTFVEVGPADRLSGFVRDTLRGTGVATIATNVEGRDTLAQVQFAAAQLWVRGHPLDLSALAAVRPSLGGGGAPATATRPDGGAATGGGAGSAALEPLVAAAVAAALGAPVLEPRDYDRGFFDLGLGSIGCLALVAALERETGRAIPQTLPFDYPTVRGLAAALAGDAGVAAPTPVATAAGEPIAIVGMACRFPGGADDPDAFWRLLEEGRDAVTAVPPDRPSAGRLAPAAGEEAARRGAHGAFRAGVDPGDAAVFGVSPREAGSLVPPQRLLLELAWEALEHAAIDPRGLAGTAAGVFVGISHADYASRFTPAERLAIGGYLATGNTASTAAGRVSFALGLAGPAMAVDTACSSSLAAVHLAVESLRRGESVVALSGGVNLLVSAESTVYLAEARALSPSGRCRTFDDAADGYVRGEGGGLVVLKRLADARAAGDRVLGVIRGTAVNHDGRTSGLTVPNGRAQEAVIRAALADAGIAPAAVGYVEAHGTGTSLGDPIEVGALGRVFGADRAASPPVRLGSVKTNIGHLEAAAGVAGLIKAVLQLRRRALAPTLHFSTPNSRADWSRLGAPVVTTLEPWTGETPRIAGVSSFGISGTNVHVVVEEPPAADAAPSAPRGVEVLPISARTPAALAATARRLAAHLREARPPLGDVARALALGRAHLPCRRAVVAGSIDEAAEALERAADAPPPTGAPLVVAWLFTGQGAQAAGMGQGLYEAEPVFRAAIERADRLLAPLVGGSVAAVMFGADPARLEQTGWAQPALFTLEYALAALWHHWGITPAIVAGHSLGEIAAATIAGVFDLEDALGLVAARARLMQALPPDGAMLSVALGPDDLARVVELSGDLSLAAINAPGRTVLSGAGAAIEAAAAALDARGIAHTRLVVSHAFHSARMDPVVGPFEREAARAAMRAPRLPVVSNVTGTVAGPEMATPGYWARHLRETVRFADAVETMAAAGVTVAMELGPRPVLSALSAASPAAAGIELLPCLAPPASESRQVAGVLARLYELGAPVRWSAVHEAAPGPRAALPTYPFERERHWIDPSPVAGAPELVAAPLLGRRRDDPDAGPSVRFENTVSSSTRAGRLVARGDAPARPAFAPALALASARAIRPGLPAVLREFAWEAPCRPGAAPREIQVVVSASVETPSRVWSRGLDEPWVAHASWRAAAGGPPAGALPALPADSERVAAAGDAVYARLADLGIEPPAPARVVASAAFGRTDAVARLRLAEPPEAPDDLRIYTLVEGAWQVLELALAGAGLGERVDPVRADVIHAAPAVPAHVDVEIAWAALDGGDVRVSLSARDPETGSPVFSAAGMLVTPRVEARAGG
ncbi:MAG: acyltransferase domain-containing protein, partial [Vicinamibacterales bacterium]